MRILEIENLKKSYRSPDGETVEVIDVPEFGLESGEQIALSGESGSGKTTFLNLVAGILRPDSGRIFLDGEDVTVLSEAERDRRRADRIGYIFQTFNLLQGYTALENVLLGMMFGKGADKEFARDLLERVGLGERAGYKPAQLSVGQQQRVTLARALANRPDIVLADEPTGNLDSKTGLEILALFEELHAAGNTIVLVTHEDEVARHAERIVRMRDGLIERDEPTARARKSA